MTTREQWRAVVGWEGRYEVSDLGRVRSLARFRVRDAKVLKGDVGFGRFAYQRFFLSRPKSDGGPYVKSIRVHRLVYEAFVGPIPEGFDVRHLDGNRRNNSPKNLSVGTRKDNMGDAHRHGTIPVGEQRWNSKLRAEDVLWIRSNPEKSRKEMAILFGVCGATITHARQGKSWKFLAD